MILTIQKQQISINGILTDVDTGIDSNGIGLVKEITSSLITHKSDELGFELKILKDRLEILYDGKTIHRQFKIDDWEVVGFDSNKMIDIQQADSTTDEYVMSLAATAYTFALGYTAKDLVFKADDGDDDDDGDDENKWYTSVPFIAGGAVVIIAAALFLRRRKKKLN
jgi:LPXTG-motif cell wall-anchored protein